MVVSSDTLHEFHLKVVGLCELMHWGCCVLINFGGRKPSLSWWMHSFSGAWLFSNRPMLYNDIVDLCGTFFQTNIDSHDMVFSTFLNHYNALAICYCIMYPQ